MSATRGWRNTTSYSCLYRGKEEYSTRHKKVQTQTKQNKAQNFSILICEILTKKKKKDIRWAQIFQDSEEFSRENPVGKKCMISASRSRTGWFWLEEELLGIWRKGAQLLWVEVWALDWCSFLLGISALTLSRRGRTRTSLSSLRLVRFYFFSLSFFGFGFFMLLQVLCFLFVKKMKLFLLMGVRCNSCRKVV